MLMADTQSAGPWGGEPNHAKSATGAQIAVAWEAKTLDNKQVTGHSCIIEDHEQDLRYFIGDLTGIERCFPVGSGEPGLGTRTRPSDPTRSHPGR